MDALELIREYGAVAVAAGTMVDHTGVPVFIVAAGMVCAAGLADPRENLMAIVIAIELTDLLLVLAGRWFAVRPAPTNGSGRTFFAAVASGAGIVRGRPLFMAIWSKWIPALGKYAPFLAAWSGSGGRLRLMLLYLPGNLLYVLAWWAAGWWSGRAVIGHSGLIAVIVGLLVVAAWLAAGVSGRMRPVRAGCSMDETDQTVRERDSRAGIEQSNHDD